MRGPYSHWDHLEHSETYLGAPLWTWQRAALKAWEAAGQKGVVEAVLTAEWHHHLRRPQTSRDQGFHRCFFAGWRN